MTSVMTPVSAGHSLVSNDLHLKELFGLDHEESERSIASSSNETVLIDSPQIDAAAVPLVSTDLDKKTPELPPSLPPYELVAKTVGLGYLPFQAKELYRKKGASFNLMIAGSPGLGKRTFINTLFGSDIIPVQRNIYSTQEHRFQLNENAFSLQFTAIDTPDFGQNIDNNHGWYPLVEHIEEQFQLYLFQNEQPDRTKVKDSRIHCCVYFIAPTGKDLPPLDLITIQQLSNKVNVIPVIAKSDTFSREELEAFKVLVRKNLASKNINVCQFISDTYLNNKINNRVPFAIIGSNNFARNSDGHLVRGRKYKWGTAEVDNEDHCDFRLLKQILIENHLIDFIVSTETHYENYRSHCLATRIVAAKRNANEEIEDYEAWDGIDQYQTYNKLPLELYLDDLLYRSPVYEKKESEIKKAFSEHVAIQEVRFKEWKQALVAKQATLNRGIDIQHRQILELQESIALLNPSVEFPSSAQLLATEIETDTQDF